MWVYLNFVFIVKDRTHRRRRHFGKKYGSLRNGSGNQFPDSLRFSKNRCTLRDNIYTFDFLWSFSYPTNINIFNIIFLVSILLTVWDFCRQRNLQFGLAFFLHDMEEFSMFLYRIPWIFPYNNIHSAWCKWDGSGEFSNGNRGRSFFCSRKWYNIFKLNNKKST